MIFIETQSESLPTISSVIMQDGALPGEPQRSELCDYNCGLQDEAIPTILGGTEARQGAWPWNAAIYYKPSAGKLQFRCGATIINSRTLITTATCLTTGGKTISHEKLLVAVRETFLYGTASPKLDIQSINIHENFTSDESVGRKLKHDFNVGLLITKSEIPFSLHVSAICLPNSDKFDFRDGSGVVVGWGYDKNHQLSENLQQLEVVGQSCFVFLKATSTYFSVHFSIIFL